MATVIDGADLLRNELIAELVCAYVGHRAFTRRTIQFQNSYNARVARQVFAARPEVSCVIVSDSAPTRSGFKKVRSGPVYYYRKSSSGRWGRSAQFCFVELAETSLAMAWRRLGLEPQR